MAKDFKTWAIVILVIAGALFLLGMYTQKQHPLFSIGTPNNPTDCSYVTDINPFDASYTLFANTGAWIAIDVNGDGNKEKFGEYSTGSTSGSLGTLLISGYNSNGDSIYTYTGSDGSVYLRLGKNSGYTTFKKDYNAASNAVTTCSGTISCTESWTCTSWSACSSGTQTRTCTDSNACGTTSSKPTESQSCTVTSTCLLQDSNGNGKVDDLELLQAINAWRLN